ncbi:hypothetical protein NBRC116598_21220 [Pseudophaeobacter arcticus]|uniref:Type II toxin-antitoxin system RelE/ParE family toxin n=1 Tax=Pseudophaeobacter arcticus TaxID=385492 RepID=A0ABQ0ALC6_9RHOB
MSEWEGKPLRVVARRTSHADRDFADWRVGAEEQDRIARDLKAVPISIRDTHADDVRFRKVGRGFEVAFVFTTIEEELTILVIGYGREKEFEDWRSLVKRAGLEALPPSVKIALEGRKKKHEL